MEGMFNSTIILSVITSLIGGIWILRNSLLKRELHPKLEISPDLTLESEEGANFVLIKIKISNHGAVRLYFDRAFFSVSYIKNNDLLKVEADREIPRIKFENKLLEKIPFFPKKWKYSYVEPSSDNHYVFSILIPNDAKYILISSKLFLREEKSDFISNASYFKILASGEVKKL